MQWLYGELDGVRAYLRGAAYQPVPKHALAEFETLNTWYYTDADRSVQPELDLRRRRTSFEEIHGGLDQTTALFEDDEGFGGGGRGGESGSKSVPVVTYWSLGNPGVLAVHV